MTTLAHKKPEFHMSGWDVFLSFLIGVVAVGAIWLLTGLLIGLFFI